MKLRSVLHLLGGSTAVYISVVACAAASDESAPEDFDASEHDAHGARDGRGILDVLTDPVSAANADNPLSGTRLKAKHLSATDGSKQFNYSWRDSPRNEDCQFMRASDGKLRCLPNQYAWAQYFADSACTKPVATTLTSCGAPPYLITYVSNGCADGGRYSLYKRGAQVATVYYGAPGACQQTPIETGKTAWVVDGAEIPPSSFVEATEVVDP